MYMYVVSFSLKSACVLLASFEFIFKFASDIHHYYGNVCNLIETFPLKNISNDVRQRENNFIPS